MWQRQKDTLVLKAAADKAAKVAEVCGGGCSVKQIQGPPPLPPPRPPPLPAKCKPPLLMATHPFPPTCAHLQEQRRKEREAAKTADAAKLAAKVADAAKKAGAAAAAEQGEPTAPAVKAEDAPPPPSAAEAEGEPIPEPATPKAPQLQVQGLWCERPLAAHACARSRSSRHALLGAASFAADLAPPATPHPCPGSWWACTRRACA